MAFTMTIGGTDVMPYLDVDSLDWSTPLGSRHTLGARFEDATATYRPDLLQEVIFSQDATRIFAGYVAEAQEADFAVEVGIATDVTIADYSLRLDHVYITLTTAAGQTLRQVVDAVWAEGDIAADFGITRDAGMAAGATLDEQTFTDASITAILNHLSELTGWPWRVTYNKVLTMAAVGSEVAPAALQVGTTALILGPAKQSIGAYGNRQLVRIGSGTQARDYTFTGDTVSRVFPLPFATAQRPSQLYDVAATAYRNVGIHGVDTLFEWTYRASDNAIVQLAEAPPGTPLDPPTGAESFTTVGWIAQFPYSVEAEDAAELAARGRWDRQPVDLPDVFDLDAGTAYAEALLRRYAVWPMPRTVQVTIWTAGFTAGQQATLTDSVRDLSGAWLITDVDITVKNGQFLEYTLTLVEGAEQQSGFREFWSGLSGVRGGASTISGGIIAAEPAPVEASGHYAFDLGGSDVIDTQDSSWFSVPHYRTWLCPASGNYSVRVDAWTTNAGTTCTPRLYDVTSSAAAVTGTASAATSRTEQTLSFVAVAAHRYRLQALPSNSTHGVYALGVVES